MKCRDAGSGPERDDSTIWWTSGIVILCTLLLCGAVSYNALGVTEHKRSRIDYIRSINDFSHSLDLDIKDSEEQLNLPISKMRYRLKRSQADKTIEPLTVILNGDARQIAALVDRIALPEKADQLTAYLTDQFEISSAIKPGSSSRSITIDALAFAMLDLSAYSALYSKPHHRLSIGTKELQVDHRKRRRFLRQISWFHSRKKRRQVAKKIRQGANLLVDSDLLPQFAERMIKKFIVHRGPNCFHAALAFHGSPMTSSSLLNVKKEKDYHRAMINYDELWRTLGRNFYEINPKKVALEYGDMLVFFDVPKDLDGPGQPINFKWIRHAATYLFDGYTWSKGSKSPNTPYSVRTLGEEWQTWRKFTKNMGVKVFRRSQPSVSPQPPMDLADWIY